MIDFEEITDRLNGLEILIEYRIKDIKNVSNCIVENNMRLNQIEYEIEQLEIGLDDEDYDYCQGLYYEIMEIENKLLECTQLLDNCKLELEFYYKMYERNCDLEKTNYHKCTCGE